MSQELLLELRSFLEPQWDLKQRVFAELLKEPLLCPEFAKDVVSLEEDRRVLAKQVRCAVSLGLSAANPLFAREDSKELMRAVFGAIRDTRWE